MSRHGHVINDLTPGSKDEVASQPVGGNFTAVITNTTALSSREKLTSNVIQATSSSELYEDVITNDFMGDSVKRLFRFFDLDQDELVGSEELYEVSSRLRTRKTTNPDIELNLGSSWSRFELVLN